MIESLTIPKDALYEQRKQRFADFCAAGLPHKKIEDWKYTDLSFLAKLTWQLQDDSFALEDFPILTDLPQDALNIILVNGIYAAVDGVELPAGLTILPIEQVIANEKFSQYIGEQSSSSLVNLNRALACQGVYLHVAKNQQITKQVHLIYINTSAEQTTQQVQQIIELEENASLTLVETHVDHEVKQNWLNKVTQVNLAAHAKLDFYKSQQHAQTTIHTNSIDIDLQQASELTHLNLSLGAKLARDTLTVRLQQHAVAKLNGAYLLSQQQHCDQHTSVQHLGSQSTSHEVYKGIIAGQATGVFNGQIVAQEQVEKISAHLTNKNLLLSKHATVNTKPELQIYADDVKCSHGVTVGQLDKQALFYLQSRGIDASAAQQLLTQAFVLDVLDIIADKNQSFKDFFVSQLLIKLAAINQDGCNE